MEAYHLQWWGSWMWFAAPSSLRHTFTCPERWPALADRTGLAQLQESHGEATAGMSQKTNWPSKEGAQCILEEIAYQFYAILFHLKSLKNQKLSLTDFKIMLQLQTVL